MQKLFDLHCFMVVFSEQQYKTFLLGSMKNDSSILFFLFIFFIFLINFILFFKLYIIVLVLPNIKMNLPHFASAYFSVSL